MKEKKLEGNDCVHTSQDKHLAITPADIHSTGKNSICQTRTVIVFIFLVLSVFLSRIFWSKINLEVRFLPRLHLHLNTTIQQRSKINNHHGFELCIGCCDMKTTKAKFWTARIQDKQVMHLKLENKQATRTMWYLQSWMMMIVCNK